MTSQQRLIDVFSEGGIRAFRVVGSAEAFPRMGPEPISGGSRARPAQSPEAEHDNAGDATP